jgi:hypothetical protein
MLGTIPDLHRSHPAPDRRASGSAQQQVGYGGVTLGTVLVILLILVLVGDSCGSAPDLPEEARLRKTAEPCGQWDRERSKNAAF